MDSTFCEANIYASDSLYRAQNDYTDMIMGISQDMEMKIVDVSSDYAHQYHLFYCMIGYEIQKSIGYHYIFGNIRPCRYVYRTMATN